jgi:outer membrane lipoprotein-sorting protein
MNIKKYSIFLFVLTFSIGFCLVAYAYILPGPYLIKYMIQNFGKAKRLEVTQEVILYDGGPLGGGVEGTETLRYIFPDTFRSDMTYKSKQRIHIVSKGKDLTIDDGAILTPSEDWLDMYKEILLYRTTQSLKERLLFRRVSVSVSSYGRFEKKPAYILGAMHPDDTKPQVWFMKGTLHPFRWILRPRNETGSGDKLEIRYLEWAQTDENWYPMRIEFYKNDTLVKEINVKSVKINPVFSKTLFDINRIKSTYR